MTGKTFVSGDGDFRPPPYSFENITSITLIVNEPGCKTQLDALCDRFLNRPLQRNETNGFFALDEEVMFTFSRFPIAECVPNPTVGYMAYQEVCIAFRVFDKKNNLPGLYVPVLFLDGPQGGGAEYFATPPILVGRELFGLPKIRGEINLDLDMIGSLSSVLPGGDDVIMALADVLTVSSPLQTTLESVLQELGEIDAQPTAQRKTEGTEARRRELLTRQLELAADLREQQRQPLFGKRLHPLQAVDRLWGANIAAFVNGGDVDRRIRDALDAVAREGDDFDPAQWQDAVDAAINSGFFKTLWMTSSSLSYPLVALRQLHNPADFTKADHQDVIVAPFHYINLPLSLEKPHVLTIHSPELRELLGLGSQSYTIPNVKKLGYGADNAIYGDPGETKVLTD